MEWDGVVRLLARTQGAFRIRPVDTDDVWNVRWRRDPTRPSYRYGGTTGCVDHAGEIHRVYVCSFQPCICIHAVSKQKIGFPAPLHVLLVDQDPADGEDKPAVAGLTTSDEEDDGHEKNHRLHALLHLELKGWYRRYRLPHRFDRDYRHHVLRLEFTRRPRARPTTGRKTR